MKIKHKKKYWILLLVAVVVIAGLTTTLIHHNTQTTASKKIGDLTKDGDDVTSGANQRANDQAAQATNPSATSASTNSLIPVITSISRSNGDVIIHGTVAEATNGICIYDITNAAGQSIHEEEPILLKVNSYVCQALIIPGSTMPVGSWTVSATYINSDGVVSAATQKKLDI